MNCIYNFYRNRKQLLIINSKEELSEQVLLKFAELLGDNVTYDYIIQKSKFNINVGNASNFRIGDDYFM